MDLFDLVPPPSGPEPAPGRTRREDLFGGLVVFGLPAIYLGILAVTELTKHPSLALMWFPACITGLGAALCVVGRLGPGRTFVALLGCMWWCLVAAVTMVVIDILIFPF